MKNAHSTKGKLMDQYRNRRLTQKTQNLSERCKTNIVIYHTSTHGVALARI